MSNKTDVNVSGQGTTVIMVSPITGQARRWVDENVPLESWQWMGNMGFAVEPRYLEQLLEGMRGAGLKVSYA